MTRPAHPAMLALLSMTLLTASCGAGAGHEPTSSQDFALSMPIEAGSGQLQRVDLPAAALIAFQRADKGDIRIFDAQGRPLSLALLPTYPAELAVTRIKAIPFAPTDHAGKNTVVSIKMANGAEAISVEADHDAPEASEHTILLDTRQITQPVASISLAADMPVQKPVTVTVAAGADLAHWQVLAQQVLFRPDQSANLLGSGKIGLGGEALGGRYLRVSWSGAPASMVTGADLVTTPVPVARRINVAARGAVLVDAHHVRFALPAGLRPSALLVAMTAKDGVVPLRLLGRSSPEQSWAPIALGSLRQGEQGALLELGDGVAREFMIEADARSAGFSKAPDLTLQFEPVAVLAAFNGAPPYRLAVGHAEAAPKFFSTTELGAKSGPLPQARVKGDGRAVEINVGAGNGKTEFPLRILALWSALIAGVLVLGLAAYRLFKANGAQP